MTVLWILLIVLGIALIVWGAETFAEHLGMASVRLGFSSFALALLLAGAEPEELATAVTASLRDVPGVALGDVIGANVAMCLVALGVGAIVAPLPFGKRVMRYGLLSIPLGALAVGFVWDGTVSQLEGSLLVGLYLLYVISIWRIERSPPVLGEAEEVQEAQEELAANPDTTGQRVGWALFWVILGLAAIVLGSTVLVEAVRRLTSIEETQTKLGLTLIGFATAFELVVICWSTARRGASEAAIASVVGSFAYNVTMTLGVAAAVRPLQVADSLYLHSPLLMMMAALILVILLALFRQRLNRSIGIGLIILYPLFVGAVFFL